MREREEEYMKCFEQASQQATLLEAEFAFENAEMNVKYPLGLFDSLQLKPKYKETPP